MCLGFLFFKCKRNFQIFSLVPIFWNFTPSWIVMSMPTIQGFDSCGNTLCPTLVIRQCLEFVYIVYLYFPLCLLSSIIFILKSLYCSFNLVVILDSYSVAYFISWQSPLPQPPGFSKLMCVCVFNLLNTEYLV